MFLGKSDRVQDSRVFCAWGLRVRRARGRVIGRPIMMAAKCSPMGSTCALDLAEPSGSGWSSGYAVCLGSGSSSVRTSDLRG